MHCLIRARSVSIPVISSLTVSGVLDIYLFEDYRLLIFGGLVLLDLFYLSVLAAIFFRESNVLWLLTRSAASIEARAYFD